MVILFLIISLGLIQEGSLIEKIQNRFEEVKTIEAVFIQSTNSLNSIEGKFFFRQENNYRIELKNNTIISDGTSIWNVDLEKNKVIISNIDDDPLAFSLKDYIYNYPLKCKISEEKLSNGSLLTLDASDADLNFKIAKLWITKDYIIDKILVSDFSDNSFLFELHDIKLNQTLSSELFEYSTQKNFKIIDIR
jgi:outer membrane lipoprotein-sorting protein